VKAAVLTVSDGVSAGEREDRSGDALVELLAAFEPELTLGRRQPGDGPGDPARLVPLDESLCFSTTGFGLAHDYAIELVRALQAQGLTVEQYYPELGHGQQELSVRHAPALRAALDALEADELLMEALGPLRRTAYLAVKRSEAATFAAHTVAFECSQHAATF